MMNLKKLINGPYVRKTTIKSKNKYKEQSDVH